MSARDTLPDYQLHRVDSNYVSWTAHLAIVLRKELPYVAHHLLRTLHTRKVPAMVVLCTALATHLPSTGSLTFEEL